MPEQQIVNKTDLRKWRTEIPNLYDDADLDPYEFRLLVHYVRRGNCYESVRTTAECCKMSAAQVVNRRNKLAEKGWINVTQNARGTMTIEVVDKWQQNFNTYGSVQGVNRCSPDERECSPHEQKCSPHERKKEPIKKEPSKKKKGGRTKAPPDPRVNEMVSSFQGILDYPLPSWGAESKAAKSILNNGYSWDDVLACYQHLKTEPFWKAKHLGLASVHKQIGAWVAAGKPRNGTRERTYDSDFSGN